MVQGSGRGLWAPMLGLNPGLCAPCPWPLYALALSEPSPVEAGHLGLLTGCCHLCVTLPGLPWQRLVSSKPFTIQLKRRDLPTSAPLGVHGGGCVHGTRCHQAAWDQPQGQENTLIPGLGLWGKDSCFPEPVSLCVKGVDHISLMHQSLGVHLRASMRGLEL